MHGQSIRHDRYQLGVNFILVFLIILQEKVVNRERYRL